MLRQILITYFHASPFYIIGGEFLQQKDAIFEENKRMLQITLYILLYLSWYSLVVKEYHPFSLKLDLL